MGALLDGIRALNVRHGCGFPLNRAGAGVNLLKFLRNLWGKPGGIWAQIDAD